MRTSDNSEALMNAPGVEALLRQAAAEGDKTREKARLATVRKLKDVQRRIDDSRAITVPQRQQIESRLRAAKGHLELLQQDYQRLTAEVAAGGGLIGTEARLTGQIGRLAPEWQRVILRHLESVFEQLRHLPAPRVRHERHWITGRVETVYLDDGRDSQGTAKRYVQVRDAIAALHFRDEPEQVLLKEALSLAYEWLDDAGETAKYGALIEKLRTLPSVTPQHLDQVSL